MTPRPLINIIKKVDRDADIDINSLYAIDSCFAMLEVTPEDFEYDRKLT